MARRYRCARTLAVPKSSLTCCTLIHIGPGARNATVLMVRAASLSHLTWVARNTRWPSLDHSEVSVPLHSESAIGRVTPSAITSSSRPRLVPTSVCRRTPAPSGVTHMRAPVPAMSSSRRQHPSQPLKRASIFGAVDGAVCASAFAKAPARQAAVANVKKRTRFVMIVSRSLEHEVDAGAEPEAAQIHRLEIDEVLIELPMDPRVTAFEREIQPLEHEDVGAAQDVRLWRPPVRLEHVGKDAERPCSRILGGEVHEIAGLPELVSRDAGAGADVWHEGARNPRQPADLLAARQQSELRRPGEVHLLQLGGLLDRNRDGAAADRSEERRVGKEWRARWWAERDIKTEV